MKHKLLLALALGSLSAFYPFRPTKAASLELDASFRAPLFAQPNPTSRTVLLPDGKFLKFFTTDTLTDQRTGAITRFLPDATLDTTFTFSRDYRFVSAAVATDSGKVIIAATRYVYGGGFTAEEILRLNPDGSIDPTFNTATVSSGPDTISTVRTIAIQPDGKILVGGLFPTFSGTSKSAIVRLLADGTLDASFTPPTFDLEYTGLYSKPVVLADGKILIAGDFELLNGAPALKVARLNSDGSLDGAFQPSGFNPSVYPIRGVAVQSDGKIVLAGRFQFGSGIGATRAPLFRLNSDGSADPSFTSVTTISANPISTDLLMQPDGKFVACILYSVYRFNSDGSLDGSFAPPILLDTTLYPEGISARAYSLNLQANGRILVGGIFTDVNPASSPTGSQFGVVRLNADGTVDPTLGTSHRTGLEQFPSSFSRLPDGSTLVTFGVFYRRLDPAMAFNVGRLGPDGSLDGKFSLTSSDPNSFLSIRFDSLDSARLADGRILINGTDENFAFAAGRFLANGEEDSSFSFSPSAPSFQKVTPLTNGTALVWPGNDAQATIDGILSRLHRDGTRDQGFQIPAPIRSSQIVRDPDSTLRRMYLGSYVLATQADGKSLFYYLDSSDENYHLIRLNTDGSVDQSFSPTTLPPLDLIQEYPFLVDPLLGFQTQPYEGALRGVPSLLDAEILPDGRIVLAGAFTSFNGVPTRGLVRLQPDGTVDNTFSIGGGAQWIETTETPTFFPRVESIESQVDGKLLITGTFEAFNGTPLPGIASLNIDGSLDTSFTAQAKRLKYADGVARLARQPDGSFLLSGPYSFPNETVPAFLRINSIGGIPIVGSPTVAAALIGQMFSYQIVASGQPTSYSVSGLPPGFTFDPLTGLITGTPSSAKSGVYIITITATNAEGTSATHQLTLTVGSPPVFTSASSATGNVGQAFSFQLSATNQPSGYRAQDLPAGLVLDEISGLISGIPQIVGVTGVPIRVLNAVGTATATLSISIDSGPPPANDNFVDAEPINGLSGTVSGSNVQATRENGEPNHAGATGGKSVWYVWTAPSTRNYNFDTSGSSFTALLGIYEGPVVNNLIPIASGFGEVQFTAVMGTTYRIAVDGYAGAAGNFNLNWQAGSSVYGTSTFAGNPPGDTDGPRTSARFYEPTDVAFDGAGNIYIVDSSNSIIRKIDPSGVVSTLAGLSGYPGHADGAGNAARFGHPQGIVCDSSGNIYVADYQNHVIRKITPQGGVTTFAGSPGLSGSADGLGATARFFFPGGIAADASGNLYVADVVNQTIRKITPEGLVSTMAGTAGSSGSTDGDGNAARFNFPSGLVADNAGTIYVADSGNNTIRKITSAGTVTTIAGLPGSIGSNDGAGSAARFNGPLGITVDSSGFLYVADSSNHTIRKISPAADVTTLAGSPGQSGISDGMGSAARLNYPRGVKITASGDFYFADSFNHTVRQFSPSGVVTSFAGRAPAGSEDGARLQARFYSPWSCALDSAGNLFVTDTYNQTIRKITPAGIVSTFAGQPGSFGSADGQGSAARFGYPTAVTVADDGTLYIADYSNRTIRKITPGGLVGTLAGSPGQTGSDDGQGSAARFNDIYGIATDSQGNVYVADTGNHTIRKITPTGLVTTLAGLAGTPGSSDGIGSAARFNAPRGIVVDNAGNVFVGDAYNYTIRKIAPDGTVSTYAGVAGSYGTVDGTGSEARLGDVRGLTISPAGTLFATDGLVVRQIASGAIVTTIAGDKYSSGWRNSVGTHAQFNFQSGLAVDDDGNLYIADVNNHTIRFARPVGDLQITSAVSRKTHGGAGIFDIVLPLTGEPGVECRASGGAHTLVLTFNNDLASGNASIVAGVGTTAGNAVFSGKTMTVNLTGASDGQKITLRVSGVTDTFAQVLPDTEVSVNLLIGDTTGNKAVTSSDVSQTKSQSGAAVTAANFRADVNVSGTVTASDVSQVKANAGHTLP